MTGARTGRPGAAAAALLMILVITAAWWSLALWPTGAATPAWLARTQAACFGTTGSGLPDTRGWILLIGEPIGMLAALSLIWGNALRRDLHRIRQSRAWRRFAVVVSLGVVVGLTAAARRVVHATGMMAPAPAAPRGLVADAALEAGSLTLVDQHGETATIAERLDGPALLTFAFGHCGAICPTVVHEASHARAATGRHDLRLLVISLDPWRDTPGRLASLARQWELDPRDYVLSGAVHTVNGALDHLRIARQRDAATGDIDHIAVTLLLDADGTVLRRLEGGWGGLRDLVRDLPPLMTPVSHEAP